MQKPDIVPLELRPEKPLNLFVRAFACAGLSFNGISFVPVVNSPTRAMSFQSGRMKPRGMKA